MILRYFQPISNHRFLTVYSVITVCPDSPTSALNHFAEDSGFEPLRHFCPNGLANRPLHHLGNPPLKTAPIILQIEYKRYHYLQDFNLYLRDVYSFAEQSLSLCTLRYTKVIFLYISNTEHPAQSGFYETYISHFNLLDMQ